MCTGMLRTLACLFVNQNRRQQLMTETIDLHCWQQLTTTAAAAATTTTLVNRSQQCMTDIIKSELQLTCTTSMMVVVLVVGYE